MKINCLYTSIWDNEINISTNAVLNIENYEIEIEETKEDISDLDILTGEELKINNMNFEIELDGDEIHKDYREEIKKYFLYSHNF